MDFGGFLWQVKVKSPSDSYIVTPLLQDRRDGNYYCSFQPTLAGKYMIFVAGNNDICKNNELNEINDCIKGSKDGTPVVRDEDGIHIVGSPFRILITPGIIND